MDWGKLAAPFGDEDLEWRIQMVGENARGLYARVVPYVTARAIFDRLDATIGPGNWAAELRELRIGDKSGLFGGLGLKVGEEWVWKWDVAQASDIEAVKGAASGAYKRAAVLWGLGRDLYGIGETYADISDNGRHVWRGEYKNKEGQKVPGRFRWNPPRLAQIASPGASREAEPQAQRPAPAGEPRPGAASSPASPTAPTEKQIAFFTRLMDSSVWSDEEKTEALTWMTTKATRATIKDQIDWAKRTLETRKAARRA